MDLPALRETLAGFHEASFGWALGRCGWDRQEAEDVLQESYLKVIDGRARFSGRSSAKTWFFAVIRNTAAEARRRRRLRVLRFVGWGDAPQVERIASPQSRPDESQETGERREGFRGALQELPRRQREALELVFYHDLTVEEAAQAMGVSIGSARVHYERGKKKLRNLLEERESRR